MLRASRAPTSVVGMALFLRCRRQLLAGMCVEFPTVNTLRSRLTGEDFRNSSFFFSDIILLLVTTHSRPMVRSGSPCDSFDAWALALPRPIVPSARS